MQFCCSPFEDSVVEPEAVLVGLLVGEMSFKPTQRDVLQADATHFSLSFYGCLLIYE